MKKQVTLIFTNSFDQTVDRLIRKIGNDRIFRYNFDLWRDYRMSIVRNDFSIINPAGRGIRRKDVAKLFWRKPISKFRLMGAKEANEGDFYLEEEVFYTIREIRNILGKEGKIVLIEPESYERNGKLTQMEIAHRYFKVPPYEFSYDPLCNRPSRLRIVKSLSSRPLNDKDFFLWTTCVDQAELDKNTPWLIQDFVDAKLDVTVAFVRNKVWAFSLDRSLLVNQTVDWREQRPPLSKYWKQHTLPPKLGEAVKSYMAELGLHYGRLDFLYDGNYYWFLEVNPNGEWGWLDPNGKVGLLNKIVQEIHPDTVVHPIPAIKHFTSKRH
jgi:hypothetical protein